MKLHPLSAVTRGLRRGLVTASFVFFLLAMARFVLPETGQYITLIFALFPVAFVAGFLYQVLYYRSFTYELTADTLDVTAGVFGRKEREIPYRRVQNVDVTESILHRLLGVAVVNVETAGGSGTEAQLDFVTAAEARRIQQTVRDRRHRLADSSTAGTAADTDSQPDTTGATEQPGDTTPHGTGQPAATDRATAGGPTPLFSLSPVELLLLSVASFRAASIAVLLVGFPVAQDLFLGVVTWVTGVDLDPTTVTQRPDLALLAGLVALALGVLSTWAVSFVLTLFEYYNFTLGRRGDDLVYERGLLQRYSGSIPTDKIQTLTVRENLLLRQFGYAALSVETAGYSPGQSQSGGPQSAIPLADRERTMALARSLEPFGDLDFTRPPKRARRRYAVRYALVVLALGGLCWAVAQFVAGVTLWWLPALLLPLVVPAAHLKWRHLGYHVGDGQFVVRAGFWRQTIRVVPYYRLQTVFRERTVFQRRLGLAHFTADTATSSLLGSRDATAFDIESDDASRLYDLTRERLQTSVRERAGT